MANWLLKIMYILQKYADCQ